MHLILDKLFLVLYVIAFILLFNANPDNFFSGSEAGTAFKAVGFFMLFIFIGKFSDILYGVIKNERY